MSRNGQAKLKGGQADKARELDLKRNKEIFRHQPEEWIADAALRASRIEQAIHILKLTYPQAKGAEFVGPGQQGDRGHVCWDPYRSERTSGWM